MKLDLKIIPIIMGIIAVAYGIISIFQTNSLYSTYNIIGVIICLLGIYGVYISRKNLKIGGLQYLFSGIGIYAVIPSHCIYATIVFIITGIIAWIIYYKENNKIKTSNKELIIPILTIAIIVLFIACSSYLTTIEENEKGKSVNVTDLESIINDTNKENFSGELHGKLNLSKDFDYIDVIVEYYNIENESVYIAHSYCNSDVKAGIYEINATYLDQDAPNRAEIKVYDNSSHIKPIYINSVKFSSRNLGSIA